MNTRKRRAALTNKMACDPALYRRRRDQWLEETSAYLSRPITLNERGVNQRRPIRFFEWDKMVGPSSVPWHVPCSPRGAVVDLVGGVGGLSVGLLEAQVLRLGTR